MGRWVKLERQRRAAQAKGEPAPAQLAAENAALRRRIRQLEMENEFLGESKRLLRLQAPYLSVSS